MLWVFIALVVVIASILVATLKRLVEAVKQNIYVPPSDAIIDQAMPEEILEHIFSFMDPSTLLHSHNVSKYWRFHASKNQVKSSVVTRYVNEIDDSYDMKALRRNIEQKEFTNYPANYPLDTRLRDMALAERRGKKLLEIDLTSTKHLELKSGSCLRQFEKDKYIIKSSATLQYAYPQFRVGTKHFSPSNGKDILPILSLHEDGNSSPILDVTYELMMDLEDLLSNEFASGNAIMVRNLSPKKHFGFIPLDDSFVKVMMFILIPLIVHDVLYSGSFMNFLKSWFGVIASLALNVLATYENWKMISYTGHRKNVELYKKLTMATSIAAVIGLVIFYPLSARLFAFIFIFCGTFVYFLALYEYSFKDESLRPKSKNKLKLFILCATLVLLMNDWSMTIQSFIDGAIWQRLLWNTVHFAVFLLFVIWINVMACILYDPVKTFSLKFFIQWEPEVVKIMANLYCAAMFVTLYAPNWE